jgi:predicted permease
MENFVVIITFLLIGMALRRVPEFSDETGRILNLFVIYVSLPALVLINIPALDLSKNLLVPIVMPWAMLLLSVGIILALSKILHWRREVTGCFLLLIPLGNTSFLGIPMVEAFFGKELIPYALLYDQFGSFLALAIYGSLILAIYDEQSQLSVKGVVKKVVLFPPFIALVLAFILRPYSYPPVAVSLLETLAATLVPVVMVAVGFQLRFRLGREVTSQLGIGLGIKLVVMPLAALLLCRALGLEGDVVRVSIFEAGMPSMISAGALAIMANLSPALAAALVGFGIILSFVTLPLLHQIVL